MWSNMNTTQHQDLDRSQLFLVRLWAEESRGSGDGSDGSSSAGSDGYHQIEWCGKLQHVVSGQVRYFRGCPQLTDTLLQMIEENGKAQGGPSGPQSQEASAA